jgi:hypothetical protein
MAPTSMLNIYEVFYNLRMLWMCIWMTSYHVTASVSLAKSLEVYLEFRVVPQRGNQ